MIRRAAPTLPTTAVLSGGVRHAAVAPPSQHFRTTTTPHPLYEKPARLQTDVAKAEGEWASGEHVWTKADVVGVQQTHVPPKDAVDWVALAGVKMLRLGFDVVSGYKFGRVTPRRLLRRILFLETAAGIPGMVAGSLRHLRSLRTMQRDHGWIHTLLEEAENERMHMLVFMQEHKPSLAFRGCVMATQFIFWNTFFLAYLCCPRLCHRFVGYLEEEATRTYTHALELMQSDAAENDDLRAFAAQPASSISKMYWRLAEDATMLDVVFAVRADEANHRDVNHTFAGLGQDDVNPHRAK